MQRIQFGEAEPSPRSRCAAVSAGRSRTSSRALARAACAATPTPWAGHHPRLSFSIAHGRTLLDTRNDELVVEVLQLNPTARLLPTPLLWRKRKERQVPAARAVKAPRRATDAEGDRLAAYLAASSLPPLGKRDDDGKGDGDAKPGP